LDYPATTSEFQRADCAPLETGGDGRITVVDWVQAGRYAAHLDAVRAVSGPTEEQLAPQVIPSRNGLSRSLRVIDKTVISGRTVSVPLQLSAVGDENALGFSIQFDPKRLVFQKAALETGSPGVVLNLNDTEASLGRLAAAVARPSGKTFDPKAQNVLTLEFRAIAPAPEAALVSLTDNPVPCEISSAGASRLSGSFLAGTVTISDGPLVNAELNADGLKLSWPSWADSFVPESTPIGPTPGWQEIVASRLTNSTSVSVQLPLPDKPTFFRLREP